MTSNSYTKNEETPGLTFRWIIAGKKQEDNFKKIISSSHVSQFVLEIREKTFFYLQNSADGCAILHMRFICKPLVYKCGHMRYLVIPLGLSNS